MLALFWQKAVYAYVSAAVRTVPEIDIPEKIGHDDEDQCFINIFE
jgi:hypothetical protein